MEEFPPLVPGAHALARQAAFPHSPAKKQALAARRPLPGTGPASQRQPDSRTIRRASGVYRACGLVSPATSSANVTAEQSAPLQRNRRTTRLITTWAQAIAASTNHRTHRPCTPAETSRRTFRPGSSGWWPTGGATRRPAGSVPGEQRAQLVQRRAAAGAGARRGVVRVQPAGEQPEERLA